jgi:IS30 family transposase
MEKHVDFVRAGVGLPSIWHSLRDQIYLGSEEFVKRLQRRAPKDTDLGEIPRMQRRPIAKSLKAYAAEPDRNRAMAQAYLSGDYTMKQIAEHFGVHYSTVSRSVLKVEQS